MKGMHCVKTGCVLWSQEYQEYFFGDLYFAGDQSNMQGCYVLKANHRSDTPPRNRVHIDVHAMSFWQCGDWYICFAYGVNWISQEGVEQK